jgi:hypothetical protein
MKNNVLVILSSLHQKQLFKLAGIMVVFLFLITISVSSPANAKNLMQYFGRGVSSFAYFDSQIDECHYSYGYLAMSEAMCKAFLSKPIHPGPTAYLEIGIDDWCYGDFKWGTAEIILDEFVVETKGNKIKSLTASGTGTLCWEDPWCQEDPCPCLEEEAVSLEVVITSENVTVIGKSTIFSSEEGVSTMGHYNGITHPATADGNIKVGTLEIPIKPPPPPYPEQEGPMLGPPPGVISWYIFTNADLGRFNNFLISRSKF